MIVILAVLDTYQFGGILSLFMTTNFGSQDNSFKKNQESDIFCESTGLEKFSGAIFAQVGPLVETLSSFKVGVR